MYDGLLAETIRIQGDGGDWIKAYLARPLGVGPYGGVVVIHHMPGWDEASKEITRTFAVHGYLAICPHLHHREGPDASPDDAAAAARAQGMVPDARFVGDFQGALTYLRQLPQSNGKVGTIGYCSGGRQAYIAACKTDLQAAVDCYGGRVVAPADQLTERQPVAPVDMTPDLRCPLLGLFGEDDQNPDPRQVATIEAALKEHHKTYEFHSYPNAGHAFFSVDRPSYRVDAANDGWQRVWTFFGAHLK
ncbi:MAG: dienelactone hydrolase family protein [Candidatus Dormibacteraeota bacterium]|nr:dienelactone hydrolase family protein [Candidatus Dormibacteraeota bacterium]